MNVVLTDKAISKIKNFYTKDPNLHGKALRIAVQEGGCSGFSYAFRFDTASDDDLKQEYDGFSVVIDEPSNEKIHGSVVDYKETLGEEGFSIQNPNVKKSCGCGNSFEA